MVLGVTTFVLGADASIGAYFLFQALLSGDQFGRRRPIGVVRALAGGGLSFAVLLDRRGI